MCIGKMRESIINKVKVKKIYDKCQDKREIKLILWTHILRKVMLILWDGGSIKLFHAQEIMI